MTPLFHVITHYPTRSTCGSGINEKSPVTIDETRHYQGFSLVGPAGLEPTTSCVSSKRSTRLS